jgi:antitoxin VapB
MKTAKVFRHGNSQAVRLPKEFRVEGDEVIIRKSGDAVVLLPLGASRWTNVRRCAGRFKGAFERRQPPAFEKRGWTR